MSNNFPYASMRGCFDLSAYFVVGPEDCKGRPVTDVVDDALRGGATFIQLRAKKMAAKDHATSRRSSRTTISPTRCRS